MRLLSLDEASKIVTSDVALFWFRRDLRLDDNAGLFHALKRSGSVLPLFIFDTLILGRLEDKKDRRVEFILHSLRMLKAELEELGSSLLILFGDPKLIFKELHPKSVFTNHDYEPYATERDHDVARVLEPKNITFHSFKDQVIFEKEEIAKDDGSPYTVFMPYSRRWKAKLTKFYLRSYPTKKYLKSLAKVNALPFPELEDIGFMKTDLNKPERKIKTGVISRYDETRDFPAVDGTTRLSIHLRFGTVSIRKLARLAKEKNETWLNELIWREFYQMILWHFPDTNKAFKPAYDRIQWRNDANEFQAWCEGRTGYPLVDAGMRELNATGFMHNRVRMVTASFLTKHLLIDWRWGEAYFAKKLLDFDLAANNGGWQWAAGSGCDAAPYFRIFNPKLQTEKFDPKHEYIKKWVPEFESPAYPPPIIDHRIARERALKAYTTALQKG